MIELKTIYNKISKQKQNRLQEIFNGINFTFEDMYKIADNKAKRIINTYIDEWQDKGLLTGYFGTLAKNIKNKARVKNSEILELLIYGAYIEEQRKLNDIELKIFKEEANYYYKQGQEEVNKTLPKNKRKVVSVIPDAIFLALINAPNSKGYIWNEYIEAVIKYNADQIYRQATIDLQQQKELDITNDIYQNLIKRQQNSKLNIKADKISGNTDLTLIGINNMAKLEGIKVIDKNAKVQFISDMCENVTMMCSNMNGYIFNVNEMNEFDRWYGETVKELKIQRIKVKGLVLGVNLPPIRHHFHWCHSYIMYLPVVEKEEKSEYNLDIPKISKDIKPLLKGTKFNSKVKKLFNKYLTNDNTEIDNNLDVPMRYSEDKDKILLNPNHKNYKYYDLQESLTHEIIHMIDSRKGIVINNQDFIENQINLANIEIMNNKYKYNDLFMNNANYEQNMTISDIFSAVTDNQIRGAFYHDSSKWKNHKIKHSEVVSNIITAYLTNNKHSLKLIKEIKPLDRIRERLLKEYDII